jgi:predicted CXXCH cytochrome family protein
MPARDRWHAPHQSEYPGLLIAPETELCARCHGPVSELPELHTRPEVAGALCSSCHDPHGPPQGKEGGFVHTPYAEADCQACHSGLPDNASALTAPKEELCITCHSDVGDVAKADHGHAPAAEGDCLFCHDPHKADRKALLKGNAEELCFVCHDDPRQDPDLASRHEPFDNLAWIRHKPHVVAGRGC